MNNHSVTIRIGAAYDNVTITTRTGVISFDRAVMTPKQKRRLRRDVLNTVITPEMAANRRATPVLITD